MTWRRPKEIIFIRHGESLRNKVRGEHWALQNQADVDLLKGIYDHTVPLTIEGLRQPRVSGPVLISKFGLPDRIFRSDYLRAEQTTEALIEHLSPTKRAEIKIRHNDRIRERDPGYTWHMTEDQINQHFPWYQEYRRRIGPLFERPVGGESIKDLYDGRLYAFIGMLIRECPGEIVWVVCHGHVMRAARIIMERLTNAEAEAMIKEPIPNVAVTRYIYDKCSTRPTRTHLNVIYWE